MATEDEVPLDRLADRHELRPYRPDDGARTQVVSIEHDGRTLEVIVPLLDDDARVGEVVAAAVAGETVFLLCRHHRPPDDPSGAQGLLVVAVPHRDGRYRAAIAHATSVPEGLGLDPASGASAGTAGPLKAAGFGLGRPPGLDDLRAFREARPFRPFLIRTTAGKRYPVRRPEEIMMPHEAGYLILFSPPETFAQVELADVSTIREIAPEDPEAIDPAPRPVRRLGTIRASGPISVGCEPGSMPLRATPNSSASTSGARFTRSTSISTMPSIGKPSTSGSNSSGASSNTRASRARSGPSPASTVGCCESWSLS